MKVATISAQYVSPFVKTHKNNANDAAAIVEAPSRPDMRFVPVKPIEQQDMRAAYRVRELLNTHAVLRIAIRMAVLPPFLPPFFDPLTEQHEGIVFQDGKQTIISMDKA